MEQLYGTCCHYFKLTLAFSACKTQSILRFRYYNGHHSSKFLSYAFFLFSRKQQSHFNYSKSMRCIGSEVLPYQTTFWLNIQFFLPKKIFLKKEQGEGH